MGKVRNAVAKANSRLTIQLAAMLLAGSTLGSQLFGILRMRLLNADYYNSFLMPQYQAYLAAFTVPDFIFNVLTSGALSVTFIPVFNQRMMSGNKKSAWELSASIINFLALLMFTASIIIIIFAGPLVHLLFPTVSEASMALTISMMRVMAINPMLFAISAVLASIQQAAGRYVFMALAPILYNVGIIVGITWFTQGITIFGWHIFDGGIMGVALGVVFGAILQLIVSSIGLYGLGFDYQFKIYWKNQGFRRVLHLIPARSIDQGMDYLVGIVETSLASRLAPIALPAYNQVTSLHMAPINLIGVSISTAAFPKMTERLSQGRPDLFKKELQTVLRVIIWLSLPVAVFTYFTRGYIINFINNGGDPLMARLLGALSIAILFRSVYFIAARTFYARQDTKTPLYVSIFAITLNIALAVWFTMGIGMGVDGLAWAQSLVAIVEVVILFTILGMRIPGLLDTALLQAIWRMIAATVVMGVIAYITIQFLQLQNNDRSFLATFPKFLLIMVISAIAYILCSKLLKLQEVNPIIARMSKFLFNTNRARS